MELILRECLDDYGTMAWSSWWNKYWSIVDISHPYGLVSKNNPDIIYARETIERIHKTLDIR